MDVLTNSHGNVTVMPKVLEPAALNTPSKPISTKIISDTPGRLRLRIAPSHRQPEQIKHIVRMLDAQPNVSQVRTNIHNGSIVIHHDRNNESWKNVVATLQDIGMIFADITTESHSEAAATVANAVFDLNNRVEQATNNVVDLRFIFPLALGCLSVRQLLVRGLQLEIIPWYVLAWYAFDSFIKLHGVSKPQPTIATEKS
jgi:Heavy metal associated domain 2